MKKKMFISCMLLVAFMHLNAQVRVEVSDDTYIYAGGGTNDEPLEGDIIRGEEGVLISYFNESRVYRRTTFLKFDLSALPAADDIEAIKVRLYGVADAGGGINTSTNETTPTTHTICVYNMNGTSNTGVGSTIDESTFSYLSWVEMYNYAKSPAYLAGELAGVTGEGWFEIDITSEILEYVIKAGDKEVILGVCDSYIMKLPTDPADNSNSYITFHSKENESGNNPHLLLSVKGGSSINGQENTPSVRYTLSGRELKIENTNDGANVTIADVSGNVVYKGTINEDFQYLLPLAGFYVVSLENGTEICNFKVAAR